MTSAAAPAMMIRMRSPTTELVHPVPVEEVPGWTRAMASTFLQDPHGPPMPRWIDRLERGWDGERAWGVRDRGRWVATLRSEPRGLTVPGVGDTTLDVSVEAVTNVTVAATHRRQGLMAQMLDGSLRAARERGDPLSILIAAEWPIYGRFGYAPATLGADYTLHRSRAGATIGATPGRVWQVEREEFGDVAAAVYAAARRCRAGQVDRSRDWWEWLLGGDRSAAGADLPHNWLVHEGDDGPDGLLSWRATDEPGLLPPLGTVEVGDLVSANDAAYADLWSYLTGLDLVDRVKLADRPVDEPARWLVADGRTLILTEQVDSLWLRLLDVPAALAARRYAMPGEVVLEVTDDAAAVNVAGRYRLGADGDAVQCRPTTDAPDLEITQRALASIYLGGFRLRELAGAGAVRERTAGALARTQLMFATPRAPWNATSF